MDVELGTNKGAGRVPIDGNASNGGENGATISHYF